MTSPYARQDVPLTAGQLAELEALAAGGGAPSQANAWSGAVPWFERIRSLLPDVLREVKSLRLWQQAYADGYQAHLEGGRAGDCPFAVQDLVGYHAWKAGWQSRDWMTRAMRAEAELKSIKQNRLVPPLSPAPAPEEKP